jgi:epoxyqueuosine reductase
MSGNAMPSKSTWRVWPGVSVKPMSDANTAPGQPAGETHSALERVRQFLPDLVNESEENRLADFGHIPVFDEPLLGVVDGRDPIFRVFRDVVSPGHLLPPDTLRRYSPEVADLSRVSVVSWALPFSPEVRGSNREEHWPSALYSVARNNGGAVILDVSRQLTERLRGLGLAAVSPVLTEEYDAFRSAEHAFSSTWSERHVAYAAGLGRFGLHGSLITPAGSYVRFGSIIVNLPPGRVPARKDDFRAPCLATGGETCGLCRERCPVGAISENGMDKEKCYVRRNEIRERHLVSYAGKYRMQASPIVKGGTRKRGYSLGCALCLCGVPCEETDPSN